MKKLDRLAFYWWPALAVIILFSSFAGLLLLPGMKKAAARPLSKTAAVRYAAMDDKDPAGSEELAEIRVLYASDLFASSRGGSFPALRSAGNQSNPTNIIPSTTPLFLSFPAASDSCGRLLAAGNNLPPANDIIDAAPFLHPPVKTIQRAKISPKLSIELTGELKNILFPRDKLQDVVLPTDRKSWSIRAEMRFNNEGGVDYIFAESTDCHPSLYREIVSRLYQFRVTNITRSCEGMIIISYPAYSAVNSGNPADVRQ